RAKAPTNTTVSTAAPISGAHGAIQEATMPTTNGPKTNTVSSAADSYAMVDETVRTRTGSGIRSLMIATSRERDIGATCGAVAPMPTAASRMRASIDVV